MATLIKENVLLVVASSFKRTKIKTRKLKEIKSVPHAELQLLE